jgi:hypothetical protein
MKKLMVLAFIALSMLTASTTATNKADNPFPQCNPCGYVR